MDRFDERMLDRDLEELLGGDKPKDLSGRILAKRLAPRRSSSLPYWIGLGAAALFLAALILSRNDSALPPPRPAAPAPRVAREPEPLTPEVKPPPPPPPAPKPAEEIKKPEPTPLPPPKVEPPVAPPKPREEPPPPPKREGTRVQRSVAKAQPAVQLRYDARESWRAAGDDAILAGAQLKSARPVDLTLVGGALFRFEGSVRVDDVDGALGIEILEPRTTGWCDNLGCKSPVVVSSGDYKVRMDDGAALFESAASSMSISCFQGNVSAGTSSVPAGNFLGSRSGKVRALAASERAPRLLAGMAPRRLMREEFSAGTLRSGRIDNGVARVEGHDTMVVLEIKPALVSVPGATLRMRYKVAASEDIYLQLIGTDVKRQYGIFLAQPRAKQGQWQDLELRLDSIPFDYNLPAPGREKLPPGLEIGLFQCYVHGAKNCSLQIDWVEIFRATE